MIVTMQFYARLTFLTSNLLSSPCEWVHFKIIICTQLREEKKIPQLRPFPQLVFLYFQSNFFNFVQFNYQPNFIYLTSFSSQESCSASTSETKLKRKETPVGGGGVTQEIKRLHINLHLLVQLETSGQQSWSNVRLGRLFLMFLCPRRLLVCVF